jgi:uncharacterized membrane protein YczE
MVAFVLADARTTVSRLPRLLVGLVLCGVGIALMVASDLGLSPWDVLHQGISNRTGVAIGTVGILVGFVVLLAWIPLREPYGLGTVLNVLVIGVTIDVILPLLPEHPSTATQWVFLLVGAFLFGPAGALYIGCGLGSGPRDGLMTSLAKRGWSIRVVRTAMELTVLVLGWTLGGSVGIGTLLFALTIGPNTHFFLERLSLEPIAKVHPGPVIEIE